jgi:uncharacterized protein YndB with AHSA1/START domain
MTERARSIVVEEILPHPPEKIWRTLTTAGLIEEWLMPNDFLPAIGHRFTFRTKPMGNWDGVVHCEVLTLEPNRLLRYSWIGGSDDNAQYGSKLESVVTWTLTVEGEGTRLRMEHEGFRSPWNDFAYEMMSPGWGRVLQAIGRVSAKG